MISGRRHSERVVAAATALALQAALYWALTPPRPSQPRAGRPPALAAMILTATRPSRVRPPPLQATVPRMPGRAIENPVVPPTNPAEPQRHGPRAAVDWQAAMQREVRAELPRAGAPAKVRFGFPPMPAKKDLPHAFGWDDARTHRIQRLGHGVIDLGERCVITLWFPIPVCRFGKIPANGDLFKHTHGPRDAPDSLP